jgi:hypothetical protein
LRASRSSIAPAQATRAPFRMHKYCPGRGGTDIAAPITGRADKSLTVRNVTSSTRCEYNLCGRIVRGGTNPGPRRVGLMSIVPRFAASLLLAFVACSAGAPGDACCVTGGGQISLRVFNAYTAPWMFSSMAG